MDGPARRAGPLRTPSGLGPSFKPQAGETWLVGSSGRPLADVQPEINADLAIAGGQRRGLALDNERGVVAIVRLADHRDRRRDRRQIPGPLNLEFPDLRYIQPLPVQREPVAGEPDGLTAPLTLR